MQNEELCLEAIKQNNNNYKFVKITLPNINKTYNNIYNYDNKEKINEFYIIDVHNDPLLNGVDIRYL